MIGDLTSGISNAADAIGDFLGMASGIASGANTEDNRIDQRGEKLYTIRPRYELLSSEKRGTCSSIRFILPTGADENKWAEGKDKAFVEALNKNRGFINFLAKNVSYDIQEKSQVVHTFGGSEAVYFYGRAPVQVNFSGLLIDDLDNNQFSEFLNLYLNHLRGTKASKDFCYVELSLNNITFTGAFTGIQIQQESSRDTDVTFSAQFIAKSFTIASTDQYFMDNASMKSPVIKVREPDLTITQNAITATIMANINAFTAAIDAGSSIFSDINFEDYTKGFGVLPTVSDMLPFSFSDISDFFSGIADFIGTVSATIQHVVNTVDNFVKDAVSVLNSVEGALDSVINTVESAVRAVYGTVENLKDFVTTICNFPASMADKLAAVCSRGGVSSIPIAGSDSIPINTSVKMLANTLPVGSARGTKEGDTAVLAIKSSIENSNSLDISDSTTTDSDSNTSKPGPSAGKNYVDPNLNPSISPVTSGVPKLSISIGG